MFSFVFVYSPGTAMMMMTTIMVMMMAIMSILTFCNFCFLALSLYLIILHLLTTIPYPPQSAGMNDFGRLFAVKQLLISLSKPETIKELQNEVEIISGLSHRNIVGYLGAKIDTHLQVVNIFQEWVPGGSVAHLLKRFGAFTQHVVANYTRQILMGLSFLHSNDIIHRYVTPSLSLCCYSLTMTVMIMMSILTHSLLRALSI